MSKHLGGRWRVAAAGGVLICAAALHGGRALARSGGMVGFSSKDGTTCNAAFCHSGGVAPIVNFIGPDALGTGAMATFRFVVQSQAPEQLSAGFNVAASDGRLGAIEGQGSRLQNGEITQTAPKGNDANGEASWEFTWTAPGTPGEYILFGAGNSVDGFADPAGDLAATTTHVVRVQCTGDCNGDTAVTVDELILGINIALDKAAVADCDLFDGDGDGAVTVGELIVGVRNALTRCGPATP